MHTRKVTSQLLNYFFCSVFKTKQFFWVLFCVFYSETFSLWECLLLLTFFDTFNSWKKWCPIFDDPFECQWKAIFFFSWINFWAKLYLQLTLVLKTPPLRSRYYTYIFLLSWWFRLVCLSRSVTQQWHYVNMFSRISTLQ